MGYHDATECFGKATCFDKHEVLSFGKVVENNTLTRWPFWLQGAKSVGSIGENFPPTQPWHIVRGGATLAQMLARTFGPNLRDSKVNSK